jgi:hypothetical protein
LNVPVREWINAFQNDPVWVEKAVENARAIFKCNEKGTPDLFSTEL